MERLLHVSSMNDDQKNITGLLEALSPLFKVNPALKATFVGGEHARLDGHRSWVEAQGLEGRIVFTGPLGTNEVVKHMQSHDVLVLNSRRENFPCVIAEAWACGIPVMSTDVGGIREHLPPGLSARGFLLPGEAGEADWKEAWTQVSQTTWPEESLRTYAETHFSMAAVGAAYKEVYLGLRG